jgi:hypothetical protein
VCVFVCLFVWNIIPDHPAAVRKLTLLKHDVAGNLHKTHTQTHKQVVRTRTCDFTHVSSLCLQNYKCRGGKLAYARACTHTHTHTHIHTHAHPPTPTHPPTHPPTHFIGSFHMAFDISQASQGARKIHCLSAARGVSGCTFVPVKQVN